MEWMKQSVVQMLENATEQETRLVWLFMAHLTRWEAKRHE